MRAIGELDAVVELVGLAGVGKSRLLDAAWGAAEGMTIYQGACTPYGAAVPYSVYRPLLRSGSGIPVDASAELTGNRLTDIVTEYASHLLPMLPLLALPFGAKVPPTPEADAIDPEFRRLRIHDVVVDFLDATLSGPILLVVEDAHWIDDASGELTNHLVRASAGRSWAGIITRRPEGSWEIPEVDHVTSLHLEPLDRRRNPRTGDRRQHASVGRPRSRPDRRTRSGQPAVRRRAGSGALRRDFRRRRAPRHDRADHRHPLRPARPVGPEADPGGVGARQPVPRGDRQRPAERGRPHCRRRLGARRRDGVRCDRAACRVPLGFQPRPVSRHRLPGPAVHTATTSAPPGR